MSRKKDHAATRHFPPRRAARARTRANAAAPQRSPHPSTYSSAMHVPAHPTTGCSHPDPQMEAMHLTI